MNVCRHCGKPEDQHCMGYEPKMPDGCVCRPGEWMDIPSAICAAYVGNGTEYCRTCSHDAACHGARP